MTRGLVWALACSALLAPAARAVELGARLRPQFEARSFETVRADEEINETVLPIELGADGGRWEARLGLELVSAAWSGEGSSGNLDGLSELSWSLASRFREGRWIVSVGQSTSLHDGALTPREARVIEPLSAPALEAPDPRPHDAGRTLLLAAGTPFETRERALQVALAYELRSEVELFEGGRDFEGPDVVRAGAAFVWTGAASRGEVAIAGESGGTGRLDGADAYETGSELSARARWERAFSGGRLGVGTSWTARSGGSLSAGSLLRESAVRGGNWGDAELDWTRRIAGGEGTAGLRLFAVRGFAGDLGHVQALDPSLAWRREFDRASLGLRVHALTGSGRDERGFSGFGASAAVGIGVLR